jgi:hypothetical protein
LLRAAKRPLQFTTPAGVKTPRLVAFDDCSRCLLLRDIRAFTGETLSCLADLRQRLLSIELWAISLHIGLVLTARPVSSGRRTSQTAIPGLSQSSLLRQDISQSSKHAGSVNGSID